MDAAERFWTKVSKDSECWEWTAGTQYGYGIFSIGRKNVKAHRWSYEHTIGPIPENLQLDHLCRNKKCVRPDHLEAVTQTENNRRTAGYRKRKTHCKNGHSYRECGRMQNGYPVCRECDNERHRQRRKNAKQAAV